jgi:tRNA (guanine-N7-)-methyltransferase
MERASAIYTPPSWTAPLELDDVFPLPADEPAGRRPPLEVDVGCGKGRFLAARAAARRDINFLGIDRQLRRLRKVDRKLARAGLDNVRLLRIEASYAIAFLIPPRCVSTYYIFFPDPWPKRRHHRRRMFSEAFMADLDRTLLPAGVVHVATDHLDYFAEIRARLLAQPGYAEEMPFVPSEAERTDFELIFLSKGDPIGRCTFRKTGGGSR